MNDLVFVMYNLRLKSKEKQKGATKMQHESLDDIPSDDEWITEVEEPHLSTNEDWLNVLDATQHDDEEVVDPLRCMYI